MADFEIKDMGQTWLLTPTSRASRAWCRFNITDDVSISGESYVVPKQQMLEIIEKFVETDPRRFGY